MAEVFRPEFSDGQILQADDLSAGVSYARNQIAVHDRFLHTSGIAEGLWLRETDLSVAQPGGGSVQVKTVTLTAGVFVDASGRQVVVDSEVPLDPGLVTSAEADQDQLPKNWSYAYPVFIEPEDVSQPPVRSLAACRPGVATRMAEGHRLTVGARGEHLNLTNDTAPPGTPVEDARLGRLLLGFVRLDLDVDRFAQATHDLDGAGRTYVGVRASAVMGHDGRVDVRPKPTEAAGDLKLVVTDDEMAFGPATSTGGVTAVLRVTRTGVQVTGEITPKLLGPRITCGRVIDGAVLPLPDGVSDSDVGAQGNFSWHAVVTPVYKPFGTFASAPQNFGCFVDENRKAHCLLKYDTGSVQECEFLLVVLPRS